MIIDCHGPYTTAPTALEAWRNQQIVGIKDPSVLPKVTDLKISDDELRETIKANQLHLMKERGADLTIFSPRASFMAHHIGDFAISSTWAAICNELCYRVSTLFPDYFIGAAMLPQSPAASSGCAMADSGELVLATHNGGHVGATDKAHFLRSIADGAWADGDPPALVDFFYRSNRKATVAVKAIVAGFYGQRPRYAYLDG